MNNKIEKDNDLLDYLNSNCSYVDVKEQEEISGMNIDFSNTEGKEISLEDIAR